MSELDTDWLDILPADNTAMAEVHRAVEKWKNLKMALDSAAFAYDTAKQAYESCCRQLSEVFRQNGLESIKTQDGMELEVVQNVRCSITKAGKQGVAKWLRAQGAEQLVKSQLIVMPSAKAELDKLKIGYDEDLDMNTNSVKAWVKGEMEMGNVTVDQLPQGLSWFMYDDVRVKNVGAD